MNKVTMIQGGVLLSAGLVCAEGPGRPNLLILLTDDQKAETLSSYDPDCPLPTPHIDRLANEGIRFTQGFATTPICAVSRASMLTGLYSCNSGVNKFHANMPADIFERSYNMLLEEAGYFTGQLGKYGVRITPQQQARHSFWDGQAHQGPQFREYKGKTLHDSEWLTVRTGDFLDALPEGRPFALQLNYKAPHGSSVPAPEDEGLLEHYTFPRHPLDNAEAAAKVPDIVRGSFLNVCYEREFNRGGDHNPFARRYFEKVASVDRSVGEIMKMLEERGLADNTVIIFTSDHGVHFGDKHLYGKWSPYDRSLHVPFIVYDPRPNAQKGLVRDEMVLLIDIAPTILDLAGVEFPEVMDGKSLMPLVEASRPFKGDEWRDHFFFEHYHSVSRGFYLARNEGIRTRHDKFLRWLDPPEPIEEFYNLKADPLEANNLIDHPDYQQRVDELRKKFNQWREENPDNYVFAPYRQHPHNTSFSPEIDWARFKEARPEDYQAIAEAVQELDVSWEQALHDWDTRLEVGRRSGIYY